MQTTVSSKGQIVLPAPLRRALALRAGSRISIEARGDGILIRPVRRAKPKPTIAPLPAGAIKLRSRDYDFDRLAGDDDTPGA